MLTPAERTWLRHGVKKDGTGVTPTHAAVLRGRARAGVTQAFDDAMTILLSSDEALITHFEEQLAQFEKLRPKVL